MIENNSIGIMIVVVLYEQRWEHTIISDVITEVINDRSNVFRLVIYDNSTNSQQIDLDKLNFEFVYYHNPNNGMLVEAYNFALNKAIENKCEWLMLFDQDSNPDSNYFDIVLENANTISNSQSIVALTPKVFSNGKLVSPTKIDKYDRLSPISETYSGIHNGNITAINSGTVLRVSYMNVIGGFNLDFPLDILDHWYFNSIQKDNKEVFVLNCKIEHDLSIQNYNKNITTSRYRSIIDSELLFHKKYKELSQYRLFLVRLFIRFIKQIVLVKNKKIAFISLNRLMTNIFNGSFLGLKHTFSRKD